jgi:hypothetical protein
MEGAGTGAYVQYASSVSTRRQQKEHARAARLERERRAAHRAQARRRRLQLTAGAVLGMVSISVVALVFLAPGGHEHRPAAVASVKLPPYRTHDLSAAVHLADARLISYSYAFGINDHRVGKVKYPTNPPMNGPHYPVPAQDGSYLGKRPPPTGQWVHSMEHGRVVIQYRPDLPARKLAALQALYDESPYHVLLVQNNTGMPCEAAATAWGHGVLCPKLTDASVDALRAFRDRYRDHGPETVG